MKIATWNLDCVQPGLGAWSVRIREALGPIDADAWVLTESHPEFIPGAGYDLMAASTEAQDRVKGDRWVTICVRQGIEAEALVLTWELERAAALRVAVDVGGSVSVLVPFCLGASDTRWTKYRGGRAFERALTAQATNWDAVLKLLQREALHRGGPPSGTDGEWSNRDSRWPCRPRADPHSASADLRYWWGLRSDTGARMAGEYRSRGAEQRAPRNRRANTLARSVPCQTITGSAFSWRRVKDERSLYYVQSL
jgi:hypothetical protein